MTIEVTQPFIDLLYKKARDGYNECINLNENNFLQNEVAVPLSSIDVKDTEVKIIFSKESADEYLLEVYLTLYISNEVIGKYKYITSKEGNPVDDSLVFY